MVIAARNRKATIRPKAKTIKTRPSFKERVATKERESGLVPEIPPTYQKAGLGSRFHTMVVARQRVKAQIDKLEATLGTTDEPGLNQEIELALVERDLKSVLVGDWCVMACEGHNVSLKRELVQQFLLEHGVPAKTVDAAIKHGTVDKSYSYVQVQNAKKLLARINK